VFGGVWGGLSLGGSLWAQFQTFKPLFSKNGKIFSKTSRGDYIFSRTPLLNPQYSRIRRRFPILRGESLYYTILFRPNFPDRYLLLQLKILKTIPNIAPYFKD